MESSIDQKNIEVLIERLGDIGRTGDGVTRLAYTNEETAAHNLVRDYLRLYGFSSLVDAAGNTLIGDIENPSIMIGSHLDTVKNGGRYDGAAGIAAGAEALRYMKSVGEHRGICLAIFRAEESARFGKSLIGSGAFCYGINYGFLKEASDGRMTRLYDAIKSCGLDPDKTVHPDPLKEKVSAYLELHIEQADTLQKKKKVLGIVDLVAAPERYEFNLMGRFDHSGTTPIDRRADSILAQARVTELLRKMSRKSKRSEYPVIGTVTDVGTVGASMNTVCGTAYMKMDIRSAYKPARKEFVEEFLEESRKICRKEGVSLLYNAIDIKDPVQMSFVLRNMLKKVLTTAMKEHKDDAIVMNSLAGHDAMSFLAARIPAGMVLVQSTGGSHNPDEYSNPEHIALGAQVLAETAVRARELYR